MYDGEMFFLLCVFYGLDDFGDVFWLDIVDDLFYDDFVVVDYECFWYV